MKILVVKSIIFWQMASSISHNPTWKTHNFFSHPRFLVFNLHSRLCATFPKFNRFTELSSFNLVHEAHKPKPISKLHHRTQVQCLFTGIVEEMGKIKKLGISENGGFEMMIHAKTVIEDVKLGDSIAVNGTCLTVTDFDTELGEFRVGLSPETLRRTALEELSPGSPVNLERALRLDTRLGGHFVQGHVDGTGEIIAMDPEGDSLWVKVKTRQDLLKYIVPKGYVAVDGTSLTAVKVFDDEHCFNFMLVAYTQQNVAIPLKKVGQKVNLEVDILGKYVERLLGAIRLGKK